jgi:hypothetical protein
VASLPHGRGREMSNWIEIKDQEDVTVDITDDQLEVMLEPDDFGNNYIVIPLSFVFKALHDVGFDTIKMEVK